MGKGGESNVSNKGVLDAKLALRVQKLDKLETEVLRKWAKAYGVPEPESDKESLVLKLVSDTRSYRNNSLCLQKSPAHNSIRHLTLMVF